MDESGDGELQTNELRNGFKEIFNSPNENDKDEKGQRLYQKSWSDAELAAFIKQVDHNDDGLLTFRDFLMASVDLTLDSFKKYCERAFERFFTNETNSMPTNELYEILCKDNIFAPVLVKNIIKLFDDDGSDSIQYQEFVEQFLKILGEDIEQTDEPITYGTIAEYIDYSFDTELKKEYDAKIAAQ